MLEYYMMESLPDIADAAPLSCLRLLLSPLQLMSAALWGVVQHRAVMHYGLLEDFITSVLDFVPEILSHSEREQLLLGLRTKVVLEMCRSDDLCGGQNIEPHFTRIGDLIKEQNEKEVSRSKMKASVDNLSKEVSTFLDHPYGKNMFYQKTVPSQSLLGFTFDSTVSDLVRKFLVNLEKLLPTPSLDQASLWLGLSGPVLKECGDLLNQPEPLWELIQHHKQDHDFSPGPLVNDFISSSLSIEQDSVEETENQFHSLFTEDINKAFVEEDTEDDGPSVEVTLDESDSDSQDYDTDSQDCDSSDAKVDQTLSDHKRTFRCLVCQQTCCSLSELKMHIIPKCSADTAGENMPVHLSERFVISTNASEGQICKKSRIKTCSVCGETFASSDDLMDHMRGHVENDSQICGDCGKNFDSYENLISHQNNECKTIKEPSVKVDYTQEMQQKEIKACVVVISRMPDDSTIFPKTISCTDGGQSLLRQDFESHQSIRLQKNQTKEFPTTSNSTNIIWIEPCKLSSLKSLSDVETCSESRNDTSIELGIMKCTLCDKTSAEIHDMKSHYHKSHNIDGPYPCPVCKRPFIRLCELLRHHSNMQQCLCTICGRCFTVHQDLIRHQKFFHDTYQISYTCEICGKRCLSDSGLRSHKRRHKQEENTVCSHCGKKFSSKYCLRVHMSRHTGGFPCPICHKKFNLKRYLQFHLNKHNGVLEPYMCEICGKHWPTKTYLRIHMVEHSVERPYKCDQCQMGYKTLSALKYHFRTKHTTLKPFKCSVCDATFAFSSGLKDHMVIHSDARPFVCTKCGQGFRRKDTLKTHLKTHQKAKCV